MLKLHEAGSLLVRERLQAQKHAREHDHRLRDQGAPRSFQSIGLLDLLGLLNSIIPLRTRLATAQALAVTVERGSLTQPGPDWKSPATEEFVVVSEHDDFAQPPPEIPRALRAPTMKLSNLSKVTTTHSLDAFSQRRK